MCSWRTFCFVKVKGLIEGQVLLFSQGREFKLGLRYWGGDYINEGPHKVESELCVCEFEIVSLPIFVFLNGFVPFFF